MANYTQRREAWITAGIDAGIDIGTQRMADLMALALNDPEVMGKGVLGADRIKKVYAKIQGLQHDLSKGRKIRHSILYVLDYKCFERCKRMVERHGDTEQRRRTDMNRLTKRTTNCPLPVLVRDRVLGPGYFVREEDYTDYRDALEKLAQYEDTGLDPEEVERYAKAEKEGRLLVPPFKVGDMVWLIVPGLSSPMPVPVCSLTWRDGKWSINADREETEPPKVVNFQICKTAFLTREDAEKALEVANND